MLLLLQPINLRRDTHHPPILLNATPRLEHDRSTMLAKSRNMPQRPLRCSLECAFLGTEKALLGGLPDHERDGGVSISAGE
jgi:hypothetical protein